MRKSPVLALLGVSLLVLGTGCNAAIEAGPATEASTVIEDGPESCIDWVHFESLQEQFNQAALVLIGTPAGQEGETPAYGSKGRTHLIDVEKILKGDPGAKPLRISSMPQTCSDGGAYPDGDPLENGQRMIIFATALDSEWFTMTPAQGVLPFDQDAELPFR